VTVVPGKDHVNLQTLARRYSCATACSPSVIESMDRWIGHLEPFSQEVAEVRRAADRLGSLI
jgi:hypothetical protein